ncbi:hypothetical protein DV735_g3602, partial [Chaetothyriales sp. CBS 134920]
MSFSSADPSPPSSRPSSPVDCSDLRRSVASLPLLSPGQSTDSSGINWDLVRLAIQLLSSATNAAQQPDVNPTVVRSLHLDATRYMVLSMPPNLNAHEMALVRSTLPKEITTADELMAVARAQPAPTKVHSNALRMGVANITGCLMALFFFLIPLFVTWINWILLFERQHQLSERALAYSIRLGKELSHRGSELPSAYQKFRDGPFGNALVSGGSWLAEGIAGGIVDGMQNAQGYHAQGQISNKEAW